MFEEYRLIFWKGEMSLAENYNEGLRGSETDFSAFEVLGERINSPFFAADVAKTESGEMILIELNDGGCCGLPPACHPIDLYAAVARRNGIEVPEEMDW